MTRRVAVVRPEPGNAQTCARAAAMGLEALSLPLFEVVALPWTVPDASDHDALLLTSANAARLAGADLRRLDSLPALVVGEATAAAARGAGLRVAITGTADARELLTQASAAGFAALLHLGGRETTIAVGGIVRRSIAVYASIARPIDPAALLPIAGGVVLLHSARAAARLAALIDEAAIDRATIAIAAISPAVARAAGPGWRDIATPLAPGDVALLEAARALAD